MTISTRTANPVVATKSPFAAEETDRRKSRLMGILSQGLPTLPTYVLDLNVLLGKPAVDLKKVGNVIRTDPSLSAQVLRLCNSALFGLRHRVISIEQAAILLGTERLRTLVLTCSVMQFAGKHLPKAQLSSFWHHSFLCALLSERLAGHLHYCEKEQAYLGGLLHDIGQLPMWILVIGEDTAHRPAPPFGWTDNIVFERDYFGMDHCKVGRWMGVSWNYMPSFIDVFEFHHAPQRAQHDPYLVGIISAADQFLAAQATAAEAHQAETAIVAEKSVAAEPPAHSGIYQLSGFAEPSTEVATTDQLTAPQQAVPAFLPLCLPELAESEHRAVMELLETEYLHLVPLVQLGMAVAASDDV